MAKKPDLSDYVEVKDRIAAFKEQYPDGRLTSEVVDTGIDGYIAVKAYAHRTPDDPTPGVGLAWEPVPGRTPFTADSELQNAETSAWGRAIVAGLIADASHGVASADEVRNRQAAPQKSPAERRMNAIKAAAWSHTHPDSSHDERVAEASALVEQAIAIYGEPKNKDDVQEIEQYFDAIFGDLTGEEPNV